MNNRASAHRAIKTVARDSYGRLIAYLAARWRDVAAAEDALSDAFAAALRVWPEAGVPERPEAWLLAAANHRLIDQARHRRIRDQTAPDVTAAFQSALQAAADMHPFPDERLPLLFVCAHPAIAPEARTPLMLQAVLGLNAARIASAFLVAPAAMGQRLVRAKTRIREAGIGFQIPDPAEWPGRLEAVLEAIYAAYGSGWDELTARDDASPDLAQEALALGRLVVAQLPDEPEAHGLLALMLHCEARRSARRDAQGAYVPLTAQDPARWSAPLQAEAEHHLHVAAQAGRLGRFQLEAAIQSAHARRALTGRTDWPAIVQLYDGLMHLAPTLGAAVCRAAALGNARSPADGLAALDELPINEVASYQPHWALRAHLLQALGRSDEARHARTHARGLTEDPAVRAFLADPVHETPGCAAGVSHRGITLQR